MWDFEDVRRAAISSLETMPLSRTRVLELAQLYNVTHWSAAGTQRPVSLRELIPLEEKETKQTEQELATEVNTNQEKPRKPPSDASLAELSHPVSVPSTTTRSPTTKPNLRSPSAKPMISFPKSDSHTVATLKRMVREVKEDVRAFIQDILAKRKKEEKDRLDEVIMTIARYEDEAEFIAESHDNIEIVQAEKRRVEDWRKALKLLKQWRNRDWPV